MSLEKIFTARGTLKECFKQVKPETILHSDEIQKKRLVDDEFRKLGSWTPDFPLYRMEGKEPIFYLARLPYNLFFKNIDEAVKQILETQNYRPNSDDAEKVIKAKTTLRLPLYELKLKKDTDEWGHFTISTSYYNKLNQTQRALAERAHGSGRQFGKVMSMLAETISETNIYTLNPDYVKKHAEEGAIARVCWLYSFDLSSNFGAVDWYVVGSNGALRGVRREKVAAEGGAQKIDISEVLKKAGRLDDYAPTQLVLLRNVLEKGNYGIVKMK